MPVSDLVAAGTLRDVPYIGPSSARIIIELVETGASATVDAAVAASRHAGKVAVAAAAARQLPQPVRDGAGARRSRATRPSCRRGTSAATFRCTRPGATAASASRRWRTRCLALGHTCMGITDHSYGLPIARGMSMEDVAPAASRDRSAQQALRRQFRVFKGIEANILADGELDLQPEERARVRVRGRVAAFAAAPRSRSDLADAARRAAAGRGDPRPSAGADVQQPGGRAGRLAARLRDGGEAAAWRSRSTATGTGRTFPTVSRARRSRRAACSRSTATRTRSASCASPTTRSRTRGSPGMPAERVINCWSNERLEEWMAEMRGDGACCSFRLFYLWLPALGRKAA